MSFTRKSRTLQGALVVFAATGAGALVSQVARAQDQQPPQPQQPAKPDKPFKIGAERMSIKAFLQILSDRGGFTFLDEAGVEGEITITAQKELTRDEALDLLRTWLSTKDRGIIRQGNLVRILTSEELKKKGGIPVRVGNDPKLIAESDEVITQVVPLRRVRSADVRNEFRGLLSDKGQLYIDATSNHLVITDTSHIIKRVLEVLDAIDKSPQLELTIKPYHLKNANAEDVAQMIKDIFPKRQQQQGGQGGQGGAPNIQQMAQQFFAGGQGGGGGGGGGRGGGGGGRGGQGGGNQGSNVENSDVNVSIDKRSNMVIVSAAKGQIELIDPIIAEVDAAPVAVAEELRSFHLVNANPVDMATILLDIFAKATTSGQPQQQGGGFGRLIQQMQGGPNAGAAGAAADGPTRNIPDPKFTVDARTNSLIVSAVPAYMKVIDKLVKDLDEDSTFRQSVLVVPLKNADATNVAKVITDLLNAAAQAANQQRTGNQNAQRVTGNTTTALAELSGDVKVVADADSNALVVTTSPKNFSRIKQIITDLDRNRRQVLIESLIAEISLDSKGELGVQWSTNWIRGIDGRAGGTSTAASDLGLGALTNGFRYLSTSDKVSMTIRALQTDGKLNVLSSPKILTLENQPATISVGQDVPFITNSRITQNGDTVNTIQYRNIGIILKVTPHINEKGDVRMIVHPEVSEIGPQSEAVPISAGVTSPVFELNYADTTIVVRDGETAVLGGMIRNELQETVQKLPIIGDIPLVGLAFRSKTSEKKKVELIVLLTPHVVDDAEQLRRRSIQTQHKFVLIPPEVISDELDRWTRGLEDGSALKAYNRGTVYLEAQQIPQAIEELEEARDLAPNDAATRFNLGLAYARSGALEKAMVELNNAQRLDPRDAETHYNLGAILWRRQDYNGAAREFKACISLDPTHDDGRKWLEKAERALKDVPQGDSK